jgi:hypothetical protein
MIGDFRDAKLCGVKCKAKSSVYEARVSERHPSQPKNMARHALSQFFVKGLARTQQPITDVSETCVFDGNVHHEDGCTRKELTVRITDVKKRKDGWYDTFFEANGHPFK